MSRKNTYTWETHELRCNTEDQREILNEYLKRLTDNNWEVFSVSPFMRGTVLCAFLVYRKRK
jgi:hypothetical protein